MAMPNFKNMKYKKFGVEFVNNAHRALAKLEYHEREGEVLHV